MFARLRRTLAHVLAGERARPTGTSSTVAITVRECTSDGADLRLFLDVTIDGGVVAPHDQERFVHAVAVPAARHWIGRNTLTDLRAQLTPALPALTDAIRETLDGIGVAVLSVDLVAAEHVLPRAAEGPADGSG